ncbi:MAG: CopG family antitoxin [Bdellovibrionales bacterium]|nr:CopG family antitoxin [Bdellovibrionales bacterium]
MKKHLKRIKTNKTAEKILSKDLSDYIHSGNFKKTHFEFYPKNQTVTIRMSESLVKALKNRAKTKGIHYQKFIRQALEKAL